MMETTCVGDCGGVRRRELFQVTHKGEAKLMLREIDWRASEDNEFGWHVKEHGGGAEGREHDSDGVGVI